MSAFFLSYKVFHFSVAALQPRPPPLSSTRPNKRRRHTVNGAPSLRISIPRSRLNDKCPKPPSSDAVFALCLPMLARMPKAAGRIEWHDATYPTSDMVSSIPASTYRPRMFSM